MGSSLHPGNHSETLLIKKAVVLGLLTSCRFISITNTTIHYLKDIISDSVPDLAHERKRRQKCGCLTVMKTLFQFKLRLIVITVVTGRT